MYCTSFRRLALDAFLLFPPPPCLYLHSAQRHQFQLPERQTQSVLDVLGREGGCEAPASNACAAACYVQRTGCS